MISKHHYGLWIHNKKCIRLIPYERITHIHHKSGFSYICMRHIILSKMRIPLGAMAKKFPESDFFRIHRNYVINKRYISKCDHLLRFIITKNDDRITISRRKKQKFQEFLIKHI